MATVPLDRLVQLPSLDERIELFDLDATALGADLYRFTPVAFSTPDTPAAVVWNGNTYSPVPMESSGWEVSGRGTVPAPQIKLANVNLAFSALAIAYGDLLGAVLTRRRTFRRYLDGESDADPTAIFAIEVYKINRKLSQNKVFIEFELSPSIDQEGRLLPGRPVLQGACTHIYRRWDGAAFDYSKATCPYTGTDYFDANGNVTTAPADVCSKRIATGCQLRFTVLPTRAFPGVARTQS